MRSMAKPLQSRPQTQVHAARQWSVPRGAADAGRVVRLVSRLLVLCLAAAATGIRFQRRQTRRSLALYGAAALRRISAALAVELGRSCPVRAPVASVTGLDFLYQ